MRKNIEHALETALAIQRIEMKAEVLNAKGPGRITNFISVAKEMPREIRLFKKHVPLAMRAQVIEAASTRWFDPNDLKTSQKHVKKTHLYYFLRRPSLTACSIMHKDFKKHFPGIVARCADGDYIYDSNHRCTVRYLRGQKHFAKYIDLRDIDNMIPKLRAQHEKQKLMATKRSRTRKRSNRTHNKQT